MADEVVSRLPRAKACGSDADRGPLPALSGLRGWISRPPARCRLTRSWPRWAEEATQAGAGLAGARGRVPAPAAAARPGTMFAPAFPKSARAPAATNPPCSRRICRACTRATPSARAEGGTGERTRELGGYSEVVARIAWRRVFGQLRFESGTLRQRVPATEAWDASTPAPAPWQCSRRARTKPRPFRSTRRPAHRHFRASAGGQHINKTDSAVRHPPAHRHRGRMPDDRSQHRNKARALQVLAARIQEKERSERAAKDAVRARVGWVGRPQRSHPHA